jgi:hypothetical protein
MCWCELKHNQNKKKKITSIKMSLIKNTVLLSIQCAFDFMIILLLQINRYSTLSTLYAQIGFKRKASFFKRVAAMQCVAPQNPKPNWVVCHQLLVQALEGYRIYLDPSDSTTKPGQSYLLFVCY